MLKTPTGTIASIPARFVGLLVIVVLPFAYGCRRPESPDQVQLRIAQSERLERLDTLCSELPKPNGFEFVYKDISR